jgi:uncharacterized membrane protein YraQ (UPF0718 family)
VVDAVFVSLVVLLLLLAAAVWWRDGVAAMTQGLRGGAQLLARFAPVLLVSFLAAGLVEVLVPREWMVRTLGPGSGWKGILVGAGAGMITPAGPFVSMPLAAVFLRSGAAPACVVAFVTGWSLLSVHRLLAWEIPILQPRFALLRFGVCLALPVLAGLLTRLATRA